MAVLQYTAQNRGTIRRHIGRLVYGVRGKHVSGTAQAGSSSTVTLPNAVDYVANHFAGSILHVTSGTGSGQQRLVTASTTAGLLTVGTVFTTSPDSTSVIELWPQGVTPSLVNDLIDEAMMDIAPIFHYPFDTNNPTLDATNRTVITLPTNVTHVWSVDYYNSSSDMYFSYRPSPWEHKLDNSTTTDPNFILVAGSKIALYPAISSDISGTDINVRGYRTPALPTDDTTSVEAHPLYVVYQAAMLLELANAEGALLDPEQSAGRAANWRAEAVKYRTAMIQNLHPLAREVIT